MKTYTKDMQLNHERVKPKNKSTFRKRSKAKPKKNDLIDDKYTAWLCSMPCVITGYTALRGIGIDNMHGHHINGRNGGRNDYEQVPLLGYLHSWGDLAYHNNTKDDFLKKNNLIFDDIKRYFHDCAKLLQEKYILQGGVIKSND